MNENEPLLTQMTVMLDQIKEAESLLIITGAGISVASGIAPFRKHKDAEWERNITNLATFAYFRQDPVRSWDWYLSRFDRLVDIQPNPAHFAITALERWAESQGKEFTLITQNIDCLHREAGSEHLIEIHGRADRVRCPTYNCEKGAPLGSIPISEVNLEDFKESKDIDHLPKCPTCGDLLRPHVLWFDEHYGEHEEYQMNRAMTQTNQADFILFIGTSFSVGITEFISSTAEMRGVSMWAVDPSPDPTSTRYQWLRARSEIALPQLITLLEAQET